MALRKINNNEMILELAFGHKIISPINEVTKGYVIGRDLATDPVFDEPDFSMCNHEQHGIFWTRDEDGVVIVKDSWFFS